MMVRYFCFLFIIVGIWFRLRGLGHWPGLNGDEAWYGIQYYKILAGQSPDWLAPTGRWMFNIFYLAPLAVVEPFLGPSFEVLRWPALLFGVLTLVAGYRILQDRSASLKALGFVALLSTSPILIAYARFGWDPSLLPFFSLALIGASLRGRTGWAALAFCCGVLVHPVMLFLLPVALLLIGHRQFRHWQELLRTRQRLAQWGFGFAVALALAIGLHQWLLPPMAFSSLDGLWSRLTDFSAFGRFLWNFAGLFGTTTVLTYIVDPSYAEAHTWLNTLFLGLLSLGALGLWVVRPAGLAEDRWSGRALVGGLFLSLWGLYLVAGEFPVMPHHERYALFLVCPFLLLVYLGFYSWLDYLPSFTKTPAIRWGSLFFILFCLWNGAMLGLFYQGYFVEMQTTGGRSHPTFLTAEVEPKKAVWLWLQSQQLDKTRSAVIGKRVLAESWWLTKPLEYLAGGSGIQVSDLQGSERLLSSLGPGEAVVVFSGSESHRMVQENLRQPYLRQDFATPLRRSFLVVYLISN